MALKREITAKIKELLGQNPKGLSITQIVAKIAINRNTAGRYLENLMVSGQVEMRQYGMAKIYRLAQRVPLSAMLSISSELIMLLDSSLRIIYANEPMYRFLGTTQEELYGKNIEYTPCATVFDDAFETLRKHAKTGLAGREWNDELPLAGREMIFSCRIAPAVFEEGQRGVSVLLEDITERKHDEQRIQESERQFRLLAENLLDMIDRRTPYGTCIYVSPSCKTLLGYRPRELLGHSVLELIHPDDAARVGKFQGGLTRKNPTGTVTCRAKHKDGHFVWLESALRGIFDEKTGEFLEIYGITRDITNRIDAEEALRESEDRYRKLVEISPDAVLVHRDGEIIYMNPAALEILGFATPGEVIGMDPSDLIHPDYRDTVRNNIQRDLKGERTPAMELQMFRADGTLVTVEGRGVLTYIGGKPTVQVAIRDITEQKRAETALRESDDLLRSITVNSPDMILLIDTQYEILFINRPITLRPEQIVGRSFLDFVPEEFRNAAVSCFEQVRMTGKQAEYSTEYQFPGGKRRIYESVVGPVFQDNKVNVLVVNARDVTKRRLVEDALRESEATARALINAPTDSVLLTDTRGVILDANETAVKRMGRRKDEVIGCLADTFLPEDIASARRSIISQVLEKKEAVRFEDTRDGIWFDTVAYPVIGANGDVTRIAIISRDITDRRMIEENLRESEENYRNLVERANDGICVIQDGVVKFCNRRITEFWGGSVDEAIGRNITDFVHPDALPGLIDLYRRRVAGESVSPIYETKLKRKDGSIFYAEINAGIVPYGGKPADLIILRDINDRKKTEERRHP